MRHYEKNSFQRQESGTRRDVHGGIVYEAGKGLQEPFVLVWLVPEIYRIQHVDAIQVLCSKEKPTVLEQGV